MLRKTLSVLALTLLCLASVGFADDEVATQEQIDKLKEEINDLEKRVMKNEKKTGLDRVNFTGDYRFEANSIDASYPAHFNGMQLQRMLVDTMFYFGQNGHPPMAPEDVGNEIRNNYADYLYFLDNFTFDQLKQMMGMFPPDMQEALLGQLLPYTYTEASDYRNSLLYTNRLRLQMNAKVAKNVDFVGRLGMYKVFGDSTGVQVFNGQSTSMNIDGTTVSVPNSDILRVERAYFTWHSPKFYLSIGRRPSTGGAPLNFRMDEPRGGSPIGTVVNYQFDGVTLGWNITEKSTFRLCYGIGYESGFGNAEVLKRPEDRLKDASFFGINWDLWKTDDMFIQISALKAFDLTDGFNGLVVMPVDPLTGHDAPPAVMRYSPSATLGDISWASLVLVREDGPFDWFATYSYMKSDPNDVTTPFGGLFSDPFDTPEKQDGDMFYVGLRYNFSNNKSKIGLEYNKGSEYWFNWGVAEDTMFSPKTSVRGDVWELYFTHRIKSKFILKLDYINYNWDYSQSGWHMGAPKDLDSTPILGFTTPESADKYMLSFIARF